MAFLHLNFDNFEFRDLGHSDFLSFKVSAPTPFYKFRIPWLSMNWTRLVLNIPLEWKD